MEPVSPALQGRFLTTGPQREAGLEAFENRPLKNLEVIVLLSFTLIASTSNWSSLSMACTGEFVLALPGRYVPVGNGKTYLRSMLWVLYWDEGD